jgi:hypothetical protein
MSATDANEELELAIMEEALQKTEDDDDEYVMVAQQAMDHSEAPSDSHDGWFKVVFHKVEALKVFWMDVLQEMKNHHEATTVCLVVL